MDNLALNIFAPEEKKLTSKRKLLKSKRFAPTQNVVKNSKKPSTNKVTNVINVLGKGSKSPSKRGSNAPASESTKKGSSFIKAKTAKPTLNPKPFLVSQKFKTLLPVSEEPSKNDSGEFTVAFVKPKLFQKKSSSVKRNPVQILSTKSDNLEEGSLNQSVKKPERVSDYRATDACSNEISKDASSSSLIENVAETQDTHDSTPSKLLSEERKKREHRPKKNDVFVPQTFSKWAINLPSTKGKIHIDFPSGLRGKEELKLKHEGQRLKRPLDDAGERVIKRRKNEFTKSDVDVSGNSVKGKSKNQFIERENTHEKNHTSSSGTVEKRKTLESKPIKSGPISSLFSYTTPVETLEEMDVEPLEEKLFSRKQFVDVGVHPHLVGNLEQLFGITKMTMVQKKTIPVLMSGKDGLIRSQTGSGKTLAYAVPIMHNLAEITPKLSRKDGVKALIVLPTRELALQTYECFVKLMRAFTWIVPGIVVGGEKRKSEKVRLRKGITILIGTPGRLLDHAEHTGNLYLHSIDWLIIDEADKLLEMGYEKDISNLMSIIESQREKSENVGRKQTVLLSATLTSGVERMANLALKDPIRVDACSEAVTEDVLVIPQTLQQKYVIIPAKMRLVALASFVIDVAELKKSDKVLVFMATQDMVDFYVELLQGVLSSSIKFYKLHGNMSQTDRTEVFNRFRSAKKGVLLSTDVAARGLDLPKVDWIVQFTAPTTPSEYVHRVGRTARVGTAGSALLFLLPSELHFLSMLNSSRIKLEEVSLDSYLKSLMKINLESKDGQRWGGGVEGAATVLQHNFEHSVLEDMELHEMACKAYKSWVRFYATYPKDLRAVFDFKSLHLGHNAKCFALRDPPKAIGGIGRPRNGDKNLKTRGKVRLNDRRKKKFENLGHVTSGTRTKKFILSEFDSGLKPLKKS